MINRAESSIPYFDRLPAGWSVIDIMSVESCGRLRTWVALAVDTDPDDLGNCPFRQGWIRIAGKHSGRDAAYEAFGNVMATRH